MNDILVTLLFAMLAATWLAWRLDSRHAAKWAMAKWLADIVVASCLFMVALMWRGEFSETWVIGVTSLAGSLVFVGDIMPWEKVFTPSTVRPGIVKAMYFALVCIAILMAFLLDGKRSFTIDFFSNLGRVDDISSAQEIVREKYEERFGYGSFASKPFTIKQSRNAFRFTIGYLSQTRQPVYGDGHDVVIVVDRRTGEARISNCEENGPNVDMRY